MKIDIVNESGENIQSNVFSALLSSISHVLAPEIKTLAIPETACFSLLLTDNRRIAELNEKYRQKRGPTDVLSFSYLEDVKLAENDDLIGEIVISVEKARQQAKERGINLGDELKFLFIHGVLHVLGFEHEKAKDEKEMLEKTHEILGKRLPFYPK